MIFAFSKDLERSVEGGVEGHGSERTEERLRAAHSGRESQKEEAEG